MAIQKTDAFVLKTQPFRSSSVIVTFFSSQLGKVKGVAKGVRGNGALYPSTFEPFNLLEVVFYEKIRSEIHLISEATIIENYAKLREDLEVLATSYYLAELVDQLTEPHDPHPSIFELLHFGLQFLPSLSPSLVARFFEVRLLHEVGLLPHLEGCLSCGERLPAKVYFSVRQGTFFCNQCQHKSSDSKATTLEALEVLRIYLGKEIAEALRYPVHESVEKEVKDLISGFLLERLGRRLSTVRFLDQVRFLKMSRELKRANFSVHEAKNNQHSN